MKEADILFLALYSLLILSNLFIMFVIGDYFKRFDRLLYHMEGIIEQYIAVIEKAIAIENDKQKSPKEEIKFANKESLKKIESDEIEGYFYEDVIKYLGGSESNAAKEFRNWMPRPVEFFHNRTVVPVDVLEAFLTNE